VFSNSVIQAVAYYVYRLIDPRDGSTFYVGKGRGNRVFEHADGVSENGDVAGDKLIRIREIKRAGLEVGHVVHRHGLDEPTAFEVEAALLDAYPGTTNLVGGHGSDERGVAHAREIIERYEATPIQPLGELIAISVNQSAIERSSLYEAVRYAWRLSAVKARAADYVLAVSQGLVIGVFKADAWHPATPEFFPALTSAMPGRWGFVGKPAPEEVAQLYLRTRLPKRPRGSVNPVRYLGPE
jgi:hypothetical protein